MTTRVLGAPVGDPARALRSLIAGAEPVQLPGVYDAVTARLAVASGARAVCLSGATVSAVELGLPDLGFVHGTDIARRAAAIVPALDGVPVLADADTGYGNALQARHTTLAYAAAGVAGLHLEDQVSPKRCGHLAGKDVVDIAEAAGRVRAAVEAGTGIVVVARTDALSVRGLDEVVDRALAFAEAGADAIFPEGAGLAELGVVRDALVAAGHDLPLVWNCSEAGAPVEAAPSTADLGAAGVRVVIHPVSALLAAAAAARATYRRIAAAGSAAETPRMSWSELTDLVGLPQLLQTEIEYADNVAAATTAAVKGTA
ncbi:isocitrate lyase/PEP mutase family protein [Nocardioides sp. BGMRC 2183]|nr:isocitrate lyase/PEP mutase family protein [Nocardioides sp. BGMRC 2183]